MNMVVGEETKVINLTIDGQQVKIKEGATVLEAAQQAGIYIPTLCEHEAVVPYGACRLCLVEIKSRGRERLVTSCLYPAEEGLVVKTNTERIARIRKTLMQLLLSRCPDSEVIQDLAKKLDCTVSGVLIGHELTDQLDELIWRGADTIYLVEAPELANFQDEPYTNILVELVRKYKPEILLCGATAIGRSLIARVATQIKAGLTADCTGLDIDMSESELSSVAPNQCVSFLEIRNIIPGSAAISSFSEATMPLPASMCRTCSYS